MYIQSRFLTQNPTFLPLCSVSSKLCRSLPFSKNLSNFALVSRRNRFSTEMSLNSKLLSQVENVPSWFKEEDMDRFVEVGNKVADAAGEVIRRYFRNSFEVLDREDLSPVTIADRAAEESMVSIILENFPSHAILSDKVTLVILLIPGKPLFGTLIALVHKGKPIVGIIDQPVLRERWIGVSRRRTTLNGQETSTRACANLSQAYLYTTSPHLFSGDAEEAFARVRSKVKVPLYGCDCYAYALLASGFVDLVVESGLKPYDFLSLVPVIEGAGGVITDWKGHQLYWEAFSHSRATSFNVVAAGDEKIHQQALDSLQWK